MLSNVEKGFLEDSYFDVLVAHDYFYQIQSVRTKTNWIVLKTEIENDKQPIVIYQRKGRDLIYRFVAMVKSVEDAVMQIKRYDTIVRK